MLNTHARCDAVSSRDPRTRFRAHERASECARARAHATAETAPWFLAAVDPPREVESRGFPLLVREAGTTLDPRGHVAAPDVEGAAEQVLRLASGRAGCQLSRRHSCPSCDVIDRDGLAEGRLAALLLSSSRRTERRTRGGCALAPLGIKRPFASVRARSETERPSAREVNLRKRARHRSGGHMSNLNDRRVANGWIRPRAVSLASSSSSSPSSSPAASSTSSGNVARRECGFSKVRISRERSGPIRCRCRARRRSLS